MRLRTRLDTVPHLPTIGIASVSLSLILSAGLSAQATYSVNAVDDVDDGTCDVGHCSLREAITAANHAADGGIIHFNIPGAGTHTIQLLAALPALEGDVIIDGTTEPDFAGTPVIELDGSLAGDAHGFDIVGSENLIRGLVINRFAWNGIQINTDCTFNMIEGNFIGTDVTGTFALGNGNAGVGIGQAANNTVGGITPAARNLISGNIEGVTIVDPTARGNVIAGNYIGTDWSGTAAIPNNQGVLLLAPDNTVGGTAQGAGNLISGNTYDGISLAPPHATGNTIVGNRIGVDASGSAALGNDVGVRVDNVADNVIGGRSSGARNLISGNREGITLLEQGATGTLIEGNYIGTNAAGDAPIPNQMGIPIYGPGNTVGGTEAGAGNLISGNTENGISIFGEFATGNLVQGNLIGTNAAGTSDLGNEQSGIAIIFASTNTVGGTTTEARNVISGNEFAGVFFLGPDTEDNVVLGNFIGTDLTGTTAVGNGDSGVSIHTATNNIIGGTETGARNIISGNHNGLMIADLGAADNRIQGNYIGTNAAGTAAIPNADSGIFVWGVNNKIGGSENGGGNLISGNTFNGILLTQTSSGTVIEGNLIGTDAMGTVALANNIGVFGNASADNIIGGTSAGARNVISGNTDTNVYLVGLDASGNVVQGNYIGTDLNGTAALLNGRGIQLIDAPENIIGGTGSSAGNLISGNANGIRIEGPDASGNFVQGNLLGTDVTGTAQLGNSGATIRLTNGASNNTIGGTGSGAGNTITGSGWIGVVLFADAGTGNRIQSNSIFDNGALGIELGRDGVTPNDDDDSDTGPNNFQNYPRLTSVVSNGGAAVQATLISAPSSSFTLDFFSNPVCDPTGFGEGQTPLGTATLMTDAAGTGTVSTAFSSITGTILTATATDATGNTSEFSECGDLTTLEVSPSPTTRTVPPGQSATYSIGVTAQGGTFEETVGLTCSGAPAGTTCTFAADEVTLSGGQASTTMTVTTVAPATTVLVVPQPLPRVPAVWSWILLLSLAGLTLVLKGIGVSGREGRGIGTGSRPMTRARWGVLAALGGLLLVLQTSCGSDGTSPPTGGTTPGTYELTVTATWESVQQVATATLVVQ